MPSFPSASDQNPLIGRLRALCAHADNGDDIRVKFRYTNAQGRVEQVENGWVYRLVERNHLGNMVVQIEVELEEGIHVRWFRVDRMENLITSEEVEVLGAPETLTEGMSKYDTLAQLIADGPDSPTVSFTATTDAGETKEIRRAYVLGVTPAGPRTNNRERVMVRVHDSELNHAFDVNSINNLVIDEPVVQDTPVESVYDTLTRLVSEGSNSTTVNFTYTERTGEVQRIQNATVHQTWPAYPQINVNEAVVKVLLPNSSERYLFAIDRISDLAVTVDTRDVLERLVGAEGVTVSFTHDSDEGMERIENAYVIQVDADVVRVSTKGQVAPRYAHSMYIGRILNLIVNEPVVQDTPVVDEPVVQDTPVMSIYDTLVRVTAVSLDSPTVSFTNTDSTGGTRELRRVYVLQIAPARPELGITEAQVEVRAYGRNTSETFNISNISNLVVDERVAGELPVENIYDILTRVASENSSTQTVSFTYTHRVDGAQRIHNARVLQTWLAYPQLDVNEAVVKVILQGNTEGQLFAIDRISNLGVNADMREALERIVGVEGYTVSFADAASHSHWSGMHLIEVTSERAKFVRDPRIHPRYSLKVLFEDISNLIVSNDVPDEANPVALTPWPGGSGRNTDRPMTGDVVDPRIITGAPTANPLAGHYFDGTDPATVSATLSQADTEETTLLLELFAYLSSRHAEGHNDDLSFTYTNARGRVERIQHGWVTGVEPVNRNGNPVVTVEMDDRTRTFRVDRMDDISTSAGPSAIPDFPWLSAARFVVFDVLPLAEEVEYFSSLMTPSSTVVNFTYRNAQGRVENISNGTVVDVQGRNRNGNFVITVETPERQGDRARTFRVDRITNLVVVFDPTSEQAISERSAVDYVDFDALDAAAEAAGLGTTQERVDRLLNYLLRDRTMETTITFDYTSAQGARSLVEQLTLMSVSESRHHSGKNILLGFLEQSDGLFARKVFRTDRIQNITVDCRPLPANLG
jgi:predicted DNA-binding transcriptional regulator YafY